MKKTYLSLLRKDLRLFYNDGAAEIQFYRGKYETDLPAVQKVIESHKKFGISIILQEELEEAQPNPPTRVRKSMKKDPVLEEFLGGEECPD